MLTEQYISVLYSLNLDEAISLKISFCEEC